MLVGVPDTRAWLCYGGAAGPLTPAQQRRGGWHGVYRRRIAGEVEREHVNIQAFDTQYNSFQLHGVAEDPSNFARSALIGSTASTNGGRNGWERGPGADATGNGVDSAESGESRVVVANDSRGFIPEGAKRKNRKRKKNDDPASEDFQGPWAAFEEDDRPAAATTVEEGAGNSGDEGDDRRVGQHGEKGAATRKEEEVADSILHVKSATDYQGRSWIETPPDTKELPPDSTCFPPKREIYSYVGHTGGVQAIRFFPRSGHLLLSASMDSTLKIWDVYHQRRLYRTYTAHKQAVRDVQWADEGRRFYSCSYDNTVKLWDTEQGKVIGSFGNGKTPYCVSVSPNDNNVFIVGSANRRAIQFDARTGNIEVEYAEHIGSVNTVTFCEEGKRLVTTADDKKMFIWEFGIPVVIKHISDPSMHSMPAVAKHPSDRYLSFQSMDNQILTYEAYGKFRFTPRRRFKGHVCAGYACKPCFSPDGRWILSGDGNGRLWVWNWKSGKNIRTLPAHDQVCIDCQWHPNMASRVATCGWDGLIKLWD